MQIEQSAMARIVFNVNSHLSKRLLIVVAALTFLSLVANGVPTTGPSTAPSTAPSTRPAATRIASTTPATTKLDERASRKKLLELTRKSIDLLQNKKFA